MHCWMKFMDYAPSLRQLGFSIRSRYSSCLAMLIAGWNACSWLLVMMCQRKNKKCSWRSRCCLQLSRRTDNLSWTRDRHRDNGWLDDITTIQAMLRLLRLLNDARWWRRWLVSISASFQSHHHNIAIALNSRCDRQQATIQSHCTLTPLMLLIPLLAICIICCCHANTYTSACKFAMFFVGGTQNENRSQILRQKLDW